MTDVQPTLFDTQPARARGPVQSQMTVDSLGADDTLKHQIALAVAHLAKRYVGLSLMHGNPSYFWDTPVTDDHITERLELVNGRRFQRNVVARTRGLMEDAGWFLAVPNVIGRTGRPTHAVVPAMCLLAALGIVT